MWKSPFGVPGTNSLGIGTGLAPLTGWLAGEPGKDELTFGGTGALLAGTGG